MILDLTLAADARIDAIGRAPGSPVWLNLGGSAVYLTRGQAASLMYALDVVLDDREPEGADEAPGEVCPACLLCEGSDQP